MATGAEAEETNLVFLSYATPDRERVMEFYSFLVGKGINPWLDKEKIVGGQNWDFEIKRALSKASVIVVFISHNSVNRRGYVQREIKIALDQAENRLVDDIYVIPIIFDDVSIPAQIKDIHCIRSDSVDCFEELARSIEEQFKRLELEGVKPQGDSALQWRSSKYNERWDGLPGYDISYEIPHFSSVDYPDVSDITSVIKGWLTQCVMEVRAVKYQQSSEFHNFGQARFFRQNTWEAAPGPASVFERMVSIGYAIWTMSAGAAHPNYYFKTFSFTLDPVTFVESLESIFSDSESAFAVIQAHVRKELLSIKHEAEEEGVEPEPLLTESSVNSGTEGWSDFENFTFHEDGILLQFSPYQVGAYVTGAHSVTVPYENIIKFMHQHVIYVLGFEHLRRRFGMDDR